MNEPFMLRALAAGLGLALIAAPLGCFVVWRRMAYFGETVSQTGLIGVALGLGLSIHPTLAVLAVTLLVSVLLLLLGRQNKVPMDSILGVLAHTALAAGVIAAAQVSSTRNDLLMSILFGDVFSVTAADLRWIYFGGAAALGVLFYLWRPLLAASVHEDMAAAEGVKVREVNAAFVLLLAFVVAIALKIVGALVTIAFLIIPAAAARPFSETPEQMAFFATIFALLSAALGLLISYSADIPGGPAIVVVLAAIFAVSMAATLWRDPG
jgi:zinc transport system permease protein